MGESRGNPKFCDITGATDAFTPSRVRGVRELFPPGSRKIDLPGAPPTSLILGDWHRAEGRPTPESVRRADKHGPNAHGEARYSRSRDMALVAKLADDTGGGGPIAMGRSSSRWLPGAGIPFPPMPPIASKLDYEGTEFARDLSTGVPIAGPVSPTPELTARKREAQMAYRY